MTKLEEMWAALAKYQKYADADGHGGTWHALCKHRSYDAAYDAAGDTVAAYKAVSCAARAIAAAAEDAQEAIDSIDTAIRLKESSNE